MVNIVRAQAKDSRYANDSIFCPKFKLRKIKLGIEEIRTDATTRRQVDTLFKFRYCRVGKDVARSRLSFLDIVNSL